MVALLHPHGRQVEVHGPQLEARVSRRSDSPSQTPSGRHLRLVVDNRADRRSVAVDRGSANALDGGSVLVVLAIAVAVFGTMFGLRLVQGAPPATAVLDASAGEVAAPAGTGLDAGVVVGAGDRVVVAEAGDSMWSIARSIAPEGDLRPVVAALIEANQGDSVQIGQQIVIPRQLLD